MTIPREAPTPTLRALPELWRERALRFRMSDADGDLYESLRLAANELEAALLAEPEPPRPPLSPELSELQVTVGRVVAIVETTPGWGEAMHDLCYAYRDYIESLARGAADRDEPRPLSHASDCPCGEDEPDPEKAHKWTMAEPSAGPCPLLTEDEDDAIRNLNPYGGLPCGESFVSYEGMAHHARKHEATGSTAPREGP